MATTKSSGGIKIEWCPDGNCRSVLVWPGCKVNKREGNASEEVNQVYDEQRIHCSGVRKCHGQHTQVLIGGDLPKQTQI